MTDLALCRDVLRESVALCELLCEMGFAPDAIQVHLGITSTPWAALLEERTGHGDVCLFVALRQGDLTWRLCVGPVPSDGKALEAQVARLLPVLYSMRAVADGSRARAKLTDIEASIRARGIRIPAST